jgi:hypothetical protein
MALPDLEGRSPAFENACYCCALMALNYPHLVECVEEHTSCCVSGISRDSLYYSMHSSRAPPTIRPRTAPIESLLWERTKPFGSPAADLADRPDDVGDNAQTVSFGSLRKG